MSVLVSAGLVNRTTYTCIGQCYVYINVLNNDIIAINCLGVLICMIVCTRCSVCLSMKMWESKSRGGIRRSRELWERERESCACEKEVRAWCFGYNVNFTLYLMYSRILSTYFRYGGVEGKKKKSSRDGQWKHNILTTFPVPHYDVRVWSHFLGDGLKKYLTNAR